MNKVLIVGAGFGGIRTALDLAKQSLPDTRIVLISDKPHFEYHPALYRVVTGRSPLEVCIPLREIFKNREIEVVEDSVTAVDLKNKEAKSEGSSYNYDFLVLALGSQTLYFNLPGIEKNSFDFKSINGALILKRHLHEVFKTCRSASTKEKSCKAHIVVIGGGTSGIELAGELIIYTKKLAQKHRMDPSLVVVDLIEAAPKLLPALPENVSTKVAKRLKRLGVNIFLNQTVVKERIHELYLKDKEISTETVIWTAGVGPCELYAKIEGLKYDQKKRVLVNEFLGALGQEDVFVIGDAAATPFAGMAQTANAGGRTVANIIGAKILKMVPKPYREKRPYCAIPVGPGWAAVMMGPLRFYGRFGWWLRRLADLRYFLSILPLGKALAAFQSGQTLSESCPICSRP